MSSYAKQIWSNSLSENKIHYWYWLEYGPGGLCLAVEASLLHASPDVPDNDLLLVFLGGKDGAERHHVSLTGREVDQLNPGVAEPHDLFKLFPSPQSYALSMEGC